MPLPSLLAHSGFGLHCQLLGLEILLIQSQLLAFLNSVAGPLHLHSLTSTDSKYEVQISHQSSARRREPLLALEYFLKQLQL